MAGTKKKGARTGTPPVHGELALSLLRRLLLAALSLLRHRLIPPFGGLIASKSARPPGALCRLARRPEHRRSRFVGSPVMSAMRRAATQETVGRERRKKMGCSMSTP